MTKGICIGIPVYNGSANLRQALDSLLAQTYSDFHAVILDDGSTDDSYGILEQYAKQDSRIMLFRNPSRTGLIAAWNRVASLSGLFFDPAYFAWFSDHDWVEPNWLEELYLALASNPSAVLAHPKTTLVDACGDIVSEVEHRLDTVSMQVVDTLQAVTLDVFGAGDAIYGLFLYEIIRQMGFLPREIMPDRLVVSGIALFGEIRHVPKACRYRRNVSLTSNASEMVARQLETLFASENEKPKAPFLRHGTYFLRRFIGQPVMLEPCSNMRALLHAYLYLVHQYNKFEAKWKEEYSDIQSSSDFLPHYELFCFIMEEKWIPKWILPSKVRLGKFKSLCSDLRQRLAEAKEKLSEQTLSRQKSEASLKEFQSLCNDLRQTLTEANERLSEQTASREEADMRVEELESKILSMQRRCEHDEISLASLQEKNSQLLVQIESLTEQTRHPFRLLGNQLFGHSKKNIGS